LSCKGQVKVTGIHSTHTTEYFTSENASFLCYLPVIIWDGCKLQWPFGRAPTCFTNRTVDMLRMFDDFSSLPTDIVRYEEVVC